MKKILLHLGRHKTGTSALQRFFAANRERLHEGGILYPTVGVRAFGHHEIADLIARSGKSDQNVRATPLFESLLSEIDSDDSSTVLISSEGIQNLSPQRVARAFDGYRVSPVVYLREQSSYLASSYAQRIHATNLTIPLEQYEDEVFSRPADYADFLESWFEAFGSRLRVAVYAQDALRNADVIDDFMDRVLGIRDLGGYERPVEAANPSLTGEYVHLKRILNEFVPDTYDQRKAFYEWFSMLSENDRNTSRFRLDLEAASKVRERYRESNRVVAERFFDREALFDLETESQGSVDTSASLSFSTFVATAKDVLARFPEFGAFTAIDPQATQYRAWRDHDAQREEELHRLRATCERLSGDLARDSEIHRLHEAYQVRNDEFEALAKAHRRDNEEIEFLRGERERLLAEREGMLVRLVLALHRMSARLLRNP